MRTAVVSAAYAALAPVAAWAQPDSPATLPAAPTTQPIPHGVLTPAEYISRLSTALETGSTEQRVEAAQNLVQIGTPDAREVITRALTGNDERAQRAAARAIADRAATDPQWVVPLSQLLGRERTLTETAARALSHYEDDARAYDALIRFARSRQQQSRVAAVHAMGEIVQKPVAQALLDLVADPSEDAAVRVAAGEALGNLSGQTAGSSDPRHWTAWWAARQAKNPLEWQQQVLAEQHPSLEQANDRTREQTRQFKASVRRLLLNQYTSAAAPEKARILLNFLNDPDADVREIGASILPEAVQNGYPITDEIHKRLIELLGDPSPDVRLQAAQSVTALADPNALDAILTQLQVETDDQVKVSLLHAVAQPGIGNVRALPVLEQMLNDPSTDVAAAAAGAVKAAAAGIKNDPAQMHDLTQTLQQTLQQRTGPPGQPNADAGLSDLRAALIGAVAALSGPDTPDALLNWFNDLLSQNESVPVRKATLEGLAALGERSADIIAHELELGVEPEPLVRQSAATALGAVGSFNYAKQLDASTLAQNEPDPRVRDSAWRAFQSLLPLKTTTARELNEWADVFARRHDLEHEAAVLKELARKLLADNDAQNLAIVRQRAGEVYLQLGQPSEATPYLRQSLVYWEAKHAQPLTVVNLVDKLMAALLQSGQYHDAVKFGEQEIRREQQNQQEIGPALRNAVDLLIRHGDPASLKDAADLIQESLSMNPALDEGYRDQLLNLRQRLPAATTTGPS
jgi:HEAT repeat protein